MKVIGVNGYPGCGKTTFENILKEKLGEFCQIRSSIQCVKNIAALIGWSGKKGEKDRKFLSDLKQLLTDYNDWPFNDIKGFKRIYEQEYGDFNVDDNKAILLVDAREPEFLERLKNELGAINIFIENNRVTKEHDNSSDSNVENYQYDYIIYNNGTLEDLNTRADEFINWIFKQI